MLEFTLIQQGLIDITKEEGTKDSRPSSSLLTCNDFKVVIDTEHPKKDGTDYIKAFNVAGYHFDHD